MFLCDHSAVVFEHHMLLSEFDAVPQGPGDLVSITTIFVKEK
jgi:hypothetical protein